MKTRFVFFIGLVLVIQLVLLAGCFGGGNTPEKVVDEVYKAVQKHDAEIIVSFMDPVFVKEEAEREGSSVKDFKKEIVQAYNEMFEVMDKMTSYSIGEVDIDGDEALAYVVVVYEGEEEEEVTIDLVKRDGKWYVRP